jgi:anthranilate/para-aminobenzoate synthase component I
MNLIEALQRENDKSRAFIAELDALPGDPGLEISKAAHREMIRRAEAAIASGDVVAMVAAAQMCGIGESAEEVIEP